MPLTILFCNLGHIISPLPSFLKCKQIRIEKKSEREVTWLWLRFNDIVSVAGEVESHLPQIPQAGLGSACKSLDWKSEFSSVAYSPSSYIVLEASWYDDHLLAM